MAPRKNSYGEIVFSDYPEFRPNLTPREMFKMGSFGGTYWRPIYSSVTDKKYKDQHKKYPASWWKNISPNLLTRPWDEYDKNINTYGRNRNCISRKFKSCIAFFATFDY